jgi:aspartate kinase
VAIVAGFQGVTDDGDLTTLGRGGGDVTGAAVAAALDASVYENYTDVDGVYSADPTLVPCARPLPALSFTEALDLSSSGAKVLHPRAVEICMDHHIPIHVRSSFDPRAGTWINGGPSTMEEAVVVGVSSDARVAKVLLEGVPDHPGSAARIFKELAAAHITARLIVQGAGVSGLAQITFVIAADALDAVPEIMQRLRRDGVITGGDVSRDVATVTIVGSRLATELGVAARMFQALARENMNVECISATDTKVACLVAESDRERAVRAVHHEFFEELDHLARGLNHVV